MADSPTPPQQRYPSLIGAGVVAGLLAGAAMGGGMDDFGLWVPLLGVVGLILGILLTFYGGARSAH